MQISRCRQVQNESARDNHNGLPNSSRPGNLGRIPCQYVALWTGVSLVREHKSFIEPTIRRASIYEIKTKLDPLQYSNTIHI